MAFYPTNLPRAYSVHTVSVGTTATLLPSPQRASNGIVVNATAALFLGGADVTTTTGFPVAAGASVTVPASKTGDAGLYAVAATATTATVLVAPSGG